VNYNSLHLFVIKFIIHSVIKDVNIQKEKDIVKITIKQSSGYKAGLLGNDYFEHLGKYGN
jgi:hypothetical protein